MARKRATPRPTETTTQTIGERSLRWEWYFPYGGFEIPNLPTQERSLRIRHIYPQIGLGTEEYDRLTQPTTGPTQESPSNPSIETVAGKVSITSGLLPPTMHTTNVLELYPTKLIQPQRTYIIAPFHPSPDTDGYDKTPVITKITELFRELTGIQESNNELTTSAGRTVPQKDITRFFGPLVADQSLGKNVETFAQTISDIITARDPNIRVTQDHQFIIFIPQNTFHLQVGEENLGNIIKTRILQKTGDTANVEITTIESLQGKDVPKDARVLWPVIPSEETREKRLRLQNDQMEQIIGSLLFTEIPVVVTSEAGSGKTELTVRSIALSHVIARMPHTFYTIGRSMSLLLQKDPKSNQRIQTHLENIRKIGFPYDPNPGKMKAKVSNILNEWFQIIGPNEGISPIDQTSLNERSDPERLRLATVLYIVSLIHNHLDKDLNQTIQFIYPHHDQELQQEKTLYDIHFHPFVASYFRKTGGTEIELGQKYLIGQSILEEFSEKDQRHIRGTILEFGDLLGPITIIDKITKSNNVSETSFLNIGSLAYILTSFAYLRSNVLTLNERLAPIMQALQFQIFEGSTKEKAQPQQPTTGQMIYYVGSRTLALKPGAPYPGAASRVARWFFYYTRTTADHWEKRLRIIGANIARPGIFHEGALDIRIPEDVPPQAIVIVPPRPELEPSEIRNRIDFVVKQIEEIQSLEQVKRIFIVNDINRNPFFLEEIQKALKQQGLEGIIRVMSIKNINLNLSSMFQQFEAETQQEKDVKIRIFVLDNTVDTSAFIKTPQHIKSENVLYKPPQSKPKKRRASPYPIETLTKRYGISHPDVPLHPFGFWVEPDKDKREGDAKTGIPDETKNQLEKELSESINRIILAVIRSTYGSLKRTLLNYATESGEALAISEEELNRMHQEDFINGMMLFTELTHLAYWLTSLPQNTIQELAQDGKPLQRIGIVPDENYGDPLSPGRRQFVNIVLATLLKSLEIIHYYETIRLIEEETRFVKVEDDGLELLDESFKREYDGVLNKLESANLLNYALEGLAHILEKIKGLEAGELGVSEKYLNLYKHLYELFVRDGRTVSLLAGIVSLYTSYWIDLFTGLSKTATSFDPRVLEQQWWQARRNWQAQNYGGLIATDEMFGVGEQIFKSITRNAPTNFFDLIRQAAYQFSPLPAGIFSMYYQALNAPTVLFDVKNILDRPNIKLTVGADDHLYDTEEDNLEKWFVQNPQMIAAYRIAAREISTKEGRILSYELPQVLTGGFIESLHYLWSATPASQMRPLWQRWDSDPIIQKGLSQSLRDLFLLTIGPAIDGYVPTTIEIGGETIRLLVSPYPFMGLVPSISSAGMVLVHNGLLIRAGKHDPQSGGIKPTDEFATANPLYMSGLEETKQKLDPDTANKIMSIVEELATTGVANLHKANSFPTLRVVVTPDLGENIPSVLDTTTEQKNIPKDTTVRKDESEEIQLKLPEGQEANIILEGAFRRSIETILSRLNWNFPLIVLQSILYRIVSITTLPLSFITTAIFDEGQDIQPLTKRIFRVFGRLSIVGDNFQRIMEEFTLAGIEQLSEFTTFLQAGLRNTTHNSTIHPVSTTVTPVIRIELGESEEASLPFDIAVNLFDYHQEIDSLIRTNGMRPLGIIPNPYGVSIAIVPQKDLQQVYTETQIENFPKIVLPQDRESRGLRFSIRRAIKDKEESGGAQTTTTTTTPPATSTTISGTTITLRQYDAGTPRHEIFHDVKQALEGILGQALNKEEFRPLGREDFRCAVIISEPTDETQRGDYSILLIEEIIKAVAFSANYLDNYEQLGSMIQQGRTPVLVIGVPENLEHGILRTFQTLKQQIKDKFQSTKDNRLQKMEESMHLVNQSYLSAMAAYALYQQLQTLHNLGRPVAERENIPFIVVTPTNLEEFITATVAGQAIKRLGVQFHTIPPTAFVNTEQFKGHQNEYVFTISSPVTTANPFRQYVATTRHRKAAFILSLNKRSKKTRVSHSAAEDLLKDLEGVTDPITKYVLSYDPEKIPPTVSTAVQTYGRIETAFENLLTGFGIPGSVVDRLRRARAIVNAMMGLHQPGPDRKAYERLTHSSKPHIDESGQVRLFPSTNPMSYLRVANEGMTFGPTHSILSIRRVEQLEEYKSPDRKVAILAANNPIVAKTRGKNLYYAYLFAYNGSKPLSEIAKAHEDSISPYYEDFTFSATPILSTEQRILNPYVAYLLGIRTNLKKRTGKGPKIGQQTTIPIVIEDEQNDPFVQSLKRLISSTLEELERGLTEDEKREIEEQKKKEYRRKEIIIGALFKLLDKKSNPWERIVLTILIDSINFNLDFFLETVSFLTQEGEEKTKSETEITELVLDVILPRYILVPKEKSSLETDILTETVGNDSETEMDTEVVTDLSESALADRHDFIPPTSRMEGLKRVIESIRTNRGDDALIETLFDMDAKRNPWVKTVSEIINGPNALRDRTAYASPSINGLLGSPRRFFRTPYIQYTRGSKLKRIPVAFVPIHSLASNPGVRSFVRKLVTTRLEKIDDFFLSIGLEKEALRIGESYYPFINELQTQTEFHILPRLEDLTHPWNENEPLDIDQSKELDQLPDLVTVLLGLIVEEFASPDGNVPEGPLTKLFDNQDFVRDLAIAIVHFIQGWNEINRDIILGSETYIHSFVYASQRAADHATDHTVKELFKAQLPEKFLRFLVSQDLEWVLKPDENISTWWATMIYYSLLNDATRVLPMIGMIFRAPVIYDSSYMPTAIASWALPYIALPYPLAIKSMGGDIDGDTVRALVMPDQHTKNPQRLSVLLEEIEQRWESIMRGDNLSQPPGNEPFNEAPETEITAYTSGTLWQVSGIITQREPTPTLIITDNPFEWAIEKSRSERLSLLFDSQTRLEPIIDQTTTPHRVLWKPVEYSEPRSIIPQIVFTAPIDTTDSETQQTHEEIKAVLGLKRYAPIDPAALDKSKANLFESPYHYYGTVLRVALRSQEKTRIYTTLAHAIFLMQLFGMYPDPSTQQLAVDALYQAARTVGFFAEDISEIQPISREKVIEFFNAIADENIRNGLLYSYQEMTTNPFNNPILGDVEKIVKKADLPPIEPVSHPGVKKQLKQLQTVIGQATVDAMVTIARLWLLSADYWRRHISEELKLETPIAIQTLVLNPSLARIERIPAQVVFGVYYEQPEGQSPIVPILGKVQIGNKEYEVFIDLNEESVIRRVIDTNTQAEIKREVVFSLMEPDRFEPRTGFLVPEISIALTDVVSNIPYDLSENEMGALLGRSVSTGQYAIYQDLVQSWIATKFQSWAETIGVHSAMILGEYIYRTMPQLSVSITPHAMLRRQTDLFSNAINLKRLVAAARAESILEPTSIILELKESDDSIEKRYVLGQLRSSPIVGRLEEMLGQESVLTISTIQPNAVQILSRTELPISERLNKELKQLVGTGSNSNRTAYAEQVIIKDSDCLASTDDATSQYVPTKLALLPTIDLLPTNLVSDMLTNKEYSRSIRERILYQAGGLKLFGKPTKSKEGEEIVIGEIVFLVPIDPQNPNEMMLQTVPILKPQDIDLDQTYIATLAREDSKWDALAKAIKTTINSHIAKLKQENDGEEKAQHARVAQIILYHRSPLRCLYRDSERQDHKLRVCKHCTGESAINQESVEEIIPASSAQTPIDAAKGFYNGTNTEEAAFLEEVRNLLSGTVSVITSNRGVHPTQHIRTKVTISPIRVHLSRAIAKPEEIIPEIMPPVITQNLQQTRAQSSEELTEQAKIDSPITLTPNIGTHTTNAVRIYVPSVSQVADHIAWLLKQFKEAKEHPSEGEPSEYYRYFAGDDTSLLAENLIFIVNTQNDRTFLETLLQKKGIPNKLWSKRIFSLEETFQDQETLQHEILLTLETNRIIPPIPQDIPGIENYILGTLLTDVTLVPETQYQSSDADYKYRVHMRLANLRFHIEPQGASKERIYYTIKMQHYDPAIQGVLQQIKKAIEGSVKEKEDQLLHQESAVASVFLKTATLHARRRNSHDQFKHTIGLLKSAIAALILDAWTFTYPLNRTEMTGLHLLFAIILQWAERIGHESTTPLNKPIDEITQNDLRLGYLGIVLGTITPNTRTPGNMPVLAQATQRPR